MTINNKDVSMAQQSLIPEERDKSLNIDKSAPNKVEKSKKNDVRWFVPLRWDHLVTTLARAVILPLATNKKNDEDMQSPVTEQVLILKNGSPATLFDSENQNDFIAMIEIDINPLSTKLMTGINDKEIVSNIGSTEDLTQYDILLFLGAIPVSNIKVIHFNSEEDKENFILKSYDNHPNNKSGEYDLFKLRASKELFNNMLSKNTLQNLESNRANKTNKANKDLKLIHDRSNSLLGSIAMLVKVIPGTKNWLDFFKNIMSEVATKNLITLEGSKLIQDPLEQKLFNFAYNKLASDTNKGLQGKVFLESLLTEIDINNLDKKSHKAFTDWHKTSLEILNNERDLPKLGDSGMKVGRAILLVLLRPKYEDILNSKNSSLEPGDDVLALASILAGAKCGFASLINSLKSIQPNYFIYSDKMVDLFNAYLNDDMPQNNSFKPIITNSKINIKTLNIGDLGIDYKFQIDGVTLFERKDHGPDELNKVLINARSGPKPINFEVDRDNMRLSYNYDYPNKRHQKVYVSVGQPTKSGAKTLRVWSPCLDLKKFKGEYNFLLLDGIMSMHSNPDTRCRIGKNIEGDKLIAMRDQMVETSGVIEIEMLEHVAHFADEFEKTFDIDTY